MMVLRKEYTSGLLLSMEVRPVSIQGLSLSYLGPGKGGLILCLRPGIALTLYGIET